MHMKTNNHSHPPHTQLAIIKKIDNNVGNLWRNCNTHTLLLRL
jgi:hypothetical protein